MPIIDLSSIVPEAQVDQLIARDAEFIAADAAHVAAANPHPQYLNSLLPRSGATPINADTNIPQGMPLGMRWIDGSGNHTNLPSGVTSGTLVQLDLLTGTTLENKYRSQIMTIPVGSGSPKLYYRTESNGVWSSWGLA